MSLQEDRGASLQLCLQYFHHEHKFWKQKRMIFWRSENWGKYNGISTWCGTSCVRLLSTYTDYICVCICTHIICHSVNFKYFLIISNTFHITNEKTLFIKEKCIHELRKTKAVNSLKQGFVWLLKYDQEPYLHFYTFKTLTCTQTVFSFYFLKFQFFKSSYFVGIPNGNIFQASEIKIHFKKIPWNAYWGGFGVFLAGLFQVFIL